MCALKKKGEGFDAIREKETNVRSNFNARRARANTTTVAMAFVHGYMCAILFLAFFERYKGALLSSSSSRVCVTDVKREG